MGERRRKWPSIAASAIRHSEAARRYRAKKKTRRAARPAERSHPRPERISPAEARHRRAMHSPGGFSGASRLTFENETMSDSVVREMTKRKAGARVALRGCDEREVVEQAAREARGAIGPPSPASSTMPENPKSRPNFFFSPAQGRMGRDTVGESPLGHSSRAGFCRAGGRPEGRDRHIGSGPVDSLAGGTAHYRRERGTDRAVEVIARFGAKEERVQRGGRRPDRLEMAADGMAAARVRKRRREYYLSGWARQGSGRAVVFLARTRRPTSGADLTSMAGLFMNESGPDALIVSGGDRGRRCRQARTERWVSTSSSRHRPKTRRIFRRACH